MAELEQTLTARFAAGFLAVAGEPVDPVVRRSTHADFQVDGALALARRLGLHGREVAEAVLSRTDLGSLVESAEVAGPGFINVRLSRSTLAELLASVNADDRLGVPLTDAPETVRRRLLAPERGQGDARRAPPLDRDRRRRRPAA